MSPIQTFDSLFQVIDISLGASVRADTRQVRRARNHDSTLQAGRRERATSNKPAEPGHWGRSDHPFSGPIQNTATPARRSSLVGPFSSRLQPPPPTPSFLTLSPDSPRSSPSGLKDLRIVSPHASRADFPFPYRSPSLHRPALVSSPRASIGTSHSRRRQKGPAHHSALISGTPSTLAPSFRVASFREQSRPLLLLRLNHPSSSTSIPPASQRDRPADRPTDRTNPNHPQSITTVAFSASRASRMPG